MGKIRGHESLSPCSSLSDLLRGPNSLRQIVLLRIKMKSNETFACRFLIDMKMIMHDGRPNWWCEVAIYNTLPTKDDTLGHQGQLRVSWCITIKRFPSIVWSKRNYIILLLEIMQCYNYLLYISHFATKIQMSCLNNIEHHHLYINNKMI